MTLVSVIVPLKATTSEYVAWAKEAIQSVLNQSFQDWELILINDHSTVSLADLKPLFSDSRLRGAKAEAIGVTNARNQAAGMATGKYLLPLDADDILPKSSIEVQVKALESLGKGFVYGNTLLRQPNSERMYRSPKYDFDTLLRTLIMPVGSLHFKSDWEKVGGWKPEMEGGLEDWEYWIALGEIGVCGHHIDVITYIYRRHKGSRLDYLRTTPGQYDFAYTNMRQLHIDTYSGRRPVGCCGGGGVRGRRVPASAAAVQDPAAALATLATKDRVNVLFIGNESGTYIYGRPSGIRYYCSEKGAPLITMDGKVGVDPADVPFLLAINGGRDFRLE